MPANFQTGEDALIAAIAEVTGLSPDEVRQGAQDDAFLDEAFSIDSITSVRLGKRLEQLGYEVTLESIASSTFGALLERMKEAQPQLLKASNEDKIPENGTWPMTRVEMTDEELPVSVDLMKEVGSGHDTVIGGIVPSLWYGLVGALVLKKNIKVMLHRMASLNTESVTVIKETKGDRTTLTFLTSLPSKEPLIRAQVTPTNKNIEKVPLLFGESPFVSIEGADKVTKLFGESGFAYKGAYRSLRKIEHFRVATEPDIDNFASCYRVQAEAHVDLSDDPVVALAQAYFILVDASFQAMIVACGTMFAPAKFSQETYVPIQNWPRLLKENGGNMSIACRYITVSATGVEGISTAYIGNTAVCSGQSTAKGFPVAIGSRCYPQFFCNSMTTFPRHTLLCFHGVAGTAQDYDSLADMMAPHGVRVLTLEFPHQGRRLKQTDDELFTTLEGLQKDIMPWLRHMLRGPGGEVKPFSIVAMSGGGVCAYGLIRDYLIPEGLVPRSFITIVSTPPFIPNEHIERTCHLTVDNVVPCLNYYSIVSGFDASDFEEVPQESAVDRLGCMLGPVHELTTADRFGHKPLSIPAYIFGMKNDPVVDQRIIGRWKDVFTRSAWRRGSGGVCWLDEKFNHFFNLVGQAEQVFQQVFFKYGVLEDVLRKNDGKDDGQGSWKKGKGANRLRRVAERATRGALEPFRRRKKIVLTDHPIVTTTTSENRESVDSQTADLGCSHVEPLCIADDSGELILPSTAGKECAMCINSEIGEVRE